MKFKEYVDGVNKMLEEHPEYGEMEMEQTERWDGEDVCLPWHKYDSKYYGRDKIYV